MKLRAMAAALLMLSGAACSTEPRVQSAGLDPAVLAQCPREVASPGDLPVLAPFPLPDGRLVVPVEQVRDREGMLVAGALVFRGAWLTCRSVVIYAEDRDAALAKQ